MTIHTLKTETSDQQDGAVLMDSVTGFVFGPVWESPGEVSDFFEWYGEREDLRNLQSGEIADLRFGWLKELQDAVSLDDRDDESMITWKLHEESETARVIVDAKHGVKIGPNFEGPWCHEYRILQNKATGLCVVEVHFYNAGYQAFGKGLTLEAAKKLANKHNVWEATGRTWQ